MKKIFAFTASIFFATHSLTAQEIADWAGFRNAVATFTFDDNLANQLSIAVPIFDKYGYKASFYIVNNWNPNYAKFKELVSQGHEVGSHSDSHAQTMPNNEIASSKATIESKIPNQQCNTITYPNCNVPDETLISQNYIGGRICSGQIDGKTPQNYNRISSIICGNTGNVNSAQAFQQKMQEAINKKGWVTFLIHEVDQGSGYSPTASSAIDGALSWAKENDSKIWVTTFRNAIMYSKERDASKITKLSGDAQSETYSLTHNLSTSLSPFDYPLSIRLQNTNNWTSVKATQKGKSVNAKIQDGYIYFDAVPNGGDIVLSNGSGEIAPPSSSSMISSSSAQPFAGSILIPGTIEAENYDINAFYDADGQNESTGYREDDAGIVPTENGYALGYTNSGDYFEYSLNVKSLGTYNVTIRGATGNSTAASVTLSVGSEKLSIQIPTLGNWNSYTTVDAGTLALTAGEQTLRLNIDSSYVNIDWIRFECASCETDGIVASFQWNFDASPSQCQIFDIHGQWIKSARLQAENVGDFWEKVKPSLRPGAYIIRLGNGKTSRHILMRK